MSAFLMASIEPCMMPRMVAHFGQPAPLSELLSAFFISFLGNVSHCAVWYKVIFKNFKKIKMQTEKTSFLKNIGEVVS